ncbi:hypothetical protein MW887_005752 [Aspergillus wentii]|nr:hypothetical protein MW887_005752 [Aspergillus wentii]
MFSLSDTVSEQLYHILVSTRSAGKNPNNMIEKIRIPGTYTSLQAAKAAAHSYFNDAGCEQKWFTEYIIEPDVHRNPNFSTRTGLSIVAVAPDETELCVCILTTPNNQCLASENEDQRVSSPQYYVIQANVEYSHDEGSIIRDINIQGTFKTHEEARKFADGVLLSEEDGITKDSYSDYLEAALNETDCGYGENVIVCATTAYGMNYLISVIKTEELESERLSEAAMQIFWD